MATRQKLNSLNRELSADLLKCALLYKSGAKNSKRAYLLPCLHACCSNCLAEKCQKAKSENLKSPQEHVCRVCGFSLTLPKNQNAFQYFFPVDYIAQNKIDSCILHNNLLSCGECGKPELVAFRCKPCSLFLCEPCCKAPPHMNHSHIRVSTMKKRDIEDYSLFRKQLLCEEHEKNLSHYCEGCEKLLCADCRVQDATTLQDCNHCLAIQLKKAFTKSREELIEVIATCQKKADSLKVQITATQSLEEELATDKNKPLHEILKTHAKMLAIINEWKMVMIRDTRDHIDNEVLVARNGTSLMSELFEGIEEASDYAFSVLKNCNEVEFFALKTHVLEHLKLLNAVTFSEDEILPTYFHKCQMAESLISAFFSQMSLFGSRSLANPTGQPLRKVNDLPLANIYERIRSKAEKETVEREDQMAVKKIQYAISILSPGSQLDETTFTAVKAKPTDDPQTTPAAGSPKVVDRVHRGINTDIIQASDSIPATSEEEPAPTQPGPCTRQIRGPDCSGCQECLEQLCLILTSKLAKEGGGREKRTAKLYHQEIMGLYKTTDTMVKKIVDSIQEIAQDTTESLKDPRKSQSYGPIIDHIWNALVDYAQVLERLMFLSIKAANGAENGTANDEKKSMKKTYEEIDKTTTNTYADKVANSGGAKSNNSKPAAASVEATKLQEGDSSRVGSGDQRAPNDEAENSLYSYFNSGFSLLDDIVSSDRLSESSVLAECVLKLAEMAKGGDCSFFSQSSDVNSTAAAAVAVAAEKNQRYEKEKNKRKIGEKLAAETIDKRENTDRDTANQLGDNGESEAAGKQNMLIHQRQKEKNTGQTTTQGAEENLETEKESRNEGMPVPGVNVLAPDFVPVPPVPMAPGVSVDSKTAHRQENNNQRQPPPLHEASMSNSSQTTTSGLQFFIPTNYSPFLNQPTSTAVNIFNEIVVTDAGTHSLKIFNSSGVFKGEMCQPGDRPGQFVNPKVVATSPQFLAVADCGNARIQIFTNRAQFISEYKSIHFSRTLAMEFFRETLFILTGFAGIFSYIIDARGTVLSHLNLSGILSEPCAMAFAPDDTLLVADKTYNCLLSFDRFWKSVSQLQLDGETASRILFTANRNLAVCSANVRLRTVELKIYSPAQKLFYRKYNVKLDCIDDILAFAITRENNPVLLTKNGLHILEKLPTEL